MKRFSIILLGALAMVMAGCSKDTHTASDNPDDNWMYNEELPVPIQFGVSSSPVTKAAGVPIVDLDDLKTDGGTIGVFALDKRTEADWSTIGFNAGNMVSPLCNKAATLGEMEGGKASLNLEGGPYYYPLTSVANYSFFAYYTRTYDSSTIIEDDKVYVPVTIAFYDVLWGSAVAAPKAGSDGYVYDGFNARYIRKVVNAGNAALPNIAFQHVTASVAFKVKKSSDTKSQKLTVKSVKLHDMVKTARLCVADKAGLDSGKLFEDGSASSSLFLKQTGALNMEATTDEQELGTMFVFPQRPGEDGEQYQTKLSGEMVVSIANTVNNTEISQTVPFEIDLAKMTLNGEVTPQDGFLAGHRYDVNFTIHEAEEIELSVTVEPYKGEHSYDYELE